jgi:hypothetical protein
MESIASSQQAPETLPLEETNSVDFSAEHDDHDDYLPMVDARIVSDADPGLGQPELVTTSTQTNSTIDGLAPLDLSKTFLLNSRAGANQTIYLDFDGHTTSGTYWNSSYKSGADIITPAYDFDGNTAAFSNAELERIQYIWQRVAEDFIPFNVNVTTQAPTDINDLIKSGTGDTRWGVRVVIGGSSYDWFGAGAGGVAYLNSFNWNSDTPTFVFEEQLGNGNEKYTTEAISHEVGHTLGLNHDGRISPQEGYYSGQGSGETGWATIMGVGYYKNLSQWSKGEYTSASNTEDDLQIITTKNGFGYRTDDTGNTIETAKALTIAGNAVSGSGIIERNTDVDVYSFLTDAGAITLNVNPALRGPNLDILAELYSANGTLIAVSNPTDRLSATIATTVSAGAYFLKIDGVGAGDPLVTGYTDYGSLGQYFISGNIVSTNLPGISLALSTDTVLEDGTNSLVYTFSRTGDISSALTVRYDVGGTATLDSDYTQTGADSFTSTAGTITFAAGANTATLTIAPKADTTIESDETVVLTLAANSSYLIGTSSPVTGTIGNDDIPVITLALATQQVQEDGSDNLIYTFTRSGDNTNALTVNYQVAGTASLANNDYTPSGADSFTSTNGKITFAAGASTATLIVDPTADTMIENNETLSLTLTAGDNYAIGTSTAVTGTILDDDRPVITLDLATSSVSEDGIENLVYTFARTGNTNSSLTVNYKIAGTATVANADFTVAGTTNFGSKTGTITFAAGSNTATLTIDPNADLILENNETVALTLTSGTNYTIGTNATITGTIADDDTPVISLDVAPANVLEDTTNNLLYTFTRTGNTANPLTVRYTVGGTASLNHDYTQSGADSFRSTSGRITFAAGSNTAILTIDPKADTAIEADETVILTLSTGSGYRVATSNVVIGTIANDEVAAASIVITDEAQPTPIMGSIPVDSVAAVRGLGVDLVLPTTKVKFTVDREAKYHNSVGFYQTLDAEGAIQTSNGILKPTDDGYIEAALQNALNNVRVAGLDLHTQNKQTTDISVNLEKAFYLPILVADGTLAEAARGNKLKATYTVFGAANPDRVEHIKLIGPNTFGFEDTFGGGDRDYNDLIIKATFG